MLAHSTMGSSAAAPGSSLSPAGLLSACGQLVLLSLRRQLLSRQTVISLVLTGLGCLIVLGWSMQRELSARRFTEEMLIALHAAFLLPMFAICYGTSGVGGEREDQTLVYLLITPLPRPLIYLMKYAAAMALVVVATMGSLLAMVYLGGAWGRESIRFYWPAALLGSLAYGSLFHLLGTAFRRGTIISLAYTFFLEGLLGNMPGIVKRVSLSFYVSCMVYDAGSEHEIGPIIGRDMFLPISGQGAAAVLGGVALVLIILGVTIFTRREFRDLS